MNKMQYVLFFCLHDSCITWTWETWKTAAWWFISCTLRQNQYFIISLCSHVFYFESRLTASPEFSGEQAADCCLNAGFHRKWKQKWKKKTTLHFIEEKDVLLHKSEEVNLFCVCEKYRPCSNWNCRGSKHSICLRFLSAAIRKIIFSVSFSACPVVTVVTILQLWTFQIKQSFLSSVGQEHFKMFVLVSLLLQPFCISESTCWVNFTGQEHVHLLCI